MFLGNAGSMTIGFLLAVRVISSATNADGAALSYPLLDTGVAILRRWLRGHSFSRADGRQIHHHDDWSHYTYNAACAVADGRGACA